MIPYISPRSYIKKEYPERQKDVLVLLAEYGPVNRYEATKLLPSKPAYSTMFQAFREVTLDGLVDKTPAGSSRAGLPIERYSLNVPGLAFTILLWGDEIRWGKMVEAQRARLPRVFGKWEHFLREGGHELAKNSLLGSVDVFLNQEYDWEKGCTEEEAAKLISNHFIMTPEKEFKRKELFRWYNILAKDPELRTWALEIMQSAIAHHLKEAEVWERARGLLLSLPTDSA